MQIPRSLQVITASDVLARETGSGLTVHILSGGTYTRALTLPPQDGEAAARAQVKAFLDKCPDIMPIHVRINNEGIDVRCSEIQSYHDPHVGPVLYTEEDASYQWWKKLHYIAAHDKNLTPDHLSGHFIIYGRTTVVPKQKW